jgi:diguanylate cyclase (GGDEF)-like protein
VTVRVEATGETGAGVELTFSFRNKLVALLIVVVGVAQLTTLIAVLLTTQRSVRQTVGEELRVAESVFERLLSTRFLQLTNSVQVLAADFGFKQAAATEDAPTIRSVLENHASRVDADVAFLVSLSGSIVASTIDPQIVDAATEVSAMLSAMQQGDHAAGAMYLGQRPYQIVAVPVFAPNRLASLFMGFAIDDVLAREFESVTGLDVTFFDGGVAAERHPVSTLAGSQREALAALLETLPRGDDARSVELELDGERFLTATRSLTPGSAPVLAVLQKSLSVALEPYYQQQWQLVGVFALTLALALAAAVALARGITEPIRRLAEAAMRIGEGNYDRRVTVTARDEIGRLGATLNTMQDEIAEREKRIVHQAHHDDLTGLPNRWLARDRLDNALRRAARYDKPVCVVMMDLDRFKQINDSLGHHVGDVVLKETARRLVARLRRSDTVARLGGDEFFVILERADAESGMRLLKHLLETVTAAYDLDGIQVSVDISAGIAEFPAHGDNATTLLRRAEIAMYDAKGSHAKVVVYEPGRDEGHFRQLAIVGDLRNAVADNQFELHYQPKADIATGRIDHAEALIRWHHPRFGFIPPDEFIPVIEQSGNIMLMTEWVLKTAIRQCRAWQAKSIDVCVAVNLSTRDLLDEHLPEIILRHLDENDVSPARLQLEITESALMRDPKYSLEVLSRLRDAGIRLSIDDFGTGYSSLAQLKRLPVHELKIDKSFILHLSRDTEDAVIVHSTIELAHTMGLEVVAEGVETRDGLKLLQEYRCDQAQGYLISKPLAAGAFAEWMSASDKRNAWFQDAA